VFAHGNTIKEAKADAENKYYAQMNIEDRITELRNKFTKTPKLDGTLLYNWHGILTGSCRFGRDDFISTHNINLNQKYTIEEFVALTQNSYGGEIIKKLIEK
jgi:hypothetical protein